MTELKHTRIILDRSAFHGTNFDTLKQGPLASLVAKGVLTVFYTSAFIEETLQFAIKNPTNFLEHWHYIASLNTRFWFRNSDRILPIELGNKARRPEYNFLGQDQIVKIVRNAARFAKGAIPEREKNETLNEVRNNYDIRIDFRSRRLSLRDSIPHAKYDFDQYFEENVEWLIKDGLMKYHYPSRGFLKVWREHRAETPFTEKYLRAWFTTMFVPVIDRQVKVDKNDRVDAEQLAFLQWADIFVSNDLAFVPRAFKLLFPAGDKRLMTSDDFTKHLASYA